MDSSEELTVLSLCTGYSGIELGLERLGLRLRPIAFVEREGFAAANLVAKVEEGKLAAAPVYTDVKTFPYERFHGLVDILLAGYPCTPFSTAGERKGKADPRHLWPYIADGIAACRPSVVFAENVEGHIAVGLRDVLHDLGELGYRTTWGIFSAAEVGAPHQRKRIFILGELADTGSARAATWLSESQQRKEGHAEKPDNGGNRRFPARLGQPQFHWEEPRTVVNTRSAESLRIPDQERAGVSEAGNASGRKAESELGGTTYGTASGVDATTSRVERLRMLGNGVVPHTAAKAFSTLAKRLAAY